MNTLETLKATRAFLDDPKNWYQGGLTPENTSVGDECPHCLLAALSRFTGHDDTAARLTRNLVRQQISPDTIISFNDDPNTTHADVLRVLDQAIEDAQ